ncbi:MAG: cysteine synthase A [Bacteroidetes bacterium GWF2_33_16]|nr:MAG: cysteine synthase A [Bacteroidetes bacterium GWE2_32_14]OFY04111.1 MAG: cysteine synthase A [Bacteroidetes bacterium GWF2_33_16]
MKAENILQTIGNTDHVRLRSLFPDLEVWIKLEKNNPGGSIKDRIAYAMISDAEEKGILKTGGTIIEPTSGNTGIGLAMVAAVKKYRIILVMPESMSVERRKIMAAYGAEFVLTQKEKGMKGSIEKAKELLNEIPDSWMPMQFENTANPDIHKKTTAQEIINDFPEGLDYLITGVGSGGHISGVGEILKQRFKSIKVFAVEPVNSPVITGGNPGPHKIQGIGAGFIPKNLNVQVLDGVISVSHDDAFFYVQKAAREEGLFVGISTGASLAAIAKKSKKFPKNSRILTFAYDGGDRYLSVDRLFSCD